MHEESLRIINQYLGDGKEPKTLAIKAIANIHLGELEKGGEILQEIMSMAKESSIGSPSFYIAMINAQLGETDIAFEWLEKAYDDHEQELYWLKVEPPFKPLYSDPRWQVVLDKVGFPE